jgi:prolyl-tRNA synthetase
MFSDADLLGIPLRVIVSPRNMKEGAVELSARDKSFRDKIPTDQAFDEIVKRVRE